MNLPIGYLGIVIIMSYHFFLLDSNDYNNLKKVLSECNLKIKKLSQKFC